MDTLDELYKQAIASNDYKRAVAIKQQIRERDQEAEERKELREAIKILDMYGITGERFAEVLADLHSNHKGEDE